MIWLTNSIDPSRADYARSLVIPIYADRDDYIAHNKMWLADKIIGKPKASDKYTVEELEADGYVGIYKKD